MNEKRLLLLCIAAGAVVALLVVVADSRTPTTSSTATVKPSSTPAPIVSPTPTPTHTFSTQKIVKFGSSGTPAEFLALMKDMTIDVIEMQSGTYRGWHHLDIDVDRTVRPLLVRPAAGATVTFDDAGGTSNHGLFYLGLGGYTSDIAFDSTGTGGIYVIQNYAIRDTALIWGGWQHNIKFAGFRVRDITGAAGGMTSHVVFVSTDGIHAPSTLEFSDFDIALSGQLVSALQIWDTAAQGVIAKRFTVSGCHWGFVGRSAAIGVEIEGWTISNCAISFDSQGPAGIVRQVHATTSGPPIIESPMVDGGGNDWQ
jgi:hypothetical protein